MSKIILYPSNWLYNAGVVGFLRVLDEYKQIGCVEFETNGEINISQHLFVRNSNVLSPAFKFLIEHITKDENLEEWLNKRDKKEKTNREKYSEYVKKYFNTEDEGYKYIRAGGKWFFGSNTPYQNLVQKKEWENFEFVKLVEKSVDSEDVNNFSCMFCKKKTIKPEWLKEEKSLSKRITIFSDPHTDELGASIGKFPNSFWNNQSSILICPVCVFMFIHHKIAFQSFNGSEIFINAPHFLLSSDLNKFVSKILQKQKEYEVRKLLGASLLQWGLKRRALLGAWTMMNLEVIIKKRVQTGPRKWDTIIDYFDLPYHIVRILIDSEIANLINRTQEEKIFDLIVNGKFSELEEANYFVLRAFLKLKNNERLSDNDPVTKYVNKYTDKEHLSNLSKILPELYAKIIKILKTEVKYG